MYEQSTSKILFDNLRLKLIALERSGNSEALKKDISRIEKKIKMFYEKEYMNS